MLATRMKGTRPVRFGYVSLFENDDLEVIEKILGRETKFLREGGWGKKKEQMPND